VTLPRDRRPELMDRADVDRAQLGRSLVDLARVNRWLGARRSALRLVLELAARVPDRPVRILDAGTGGADIPLALTRAGRRSGLQLRVIGLDLHPYTVAFAESVTATDPHIEIRQGDALALPFEDRTFDIAMMHTTLHHFGSEEAARALRELDRVSRWGVVVTDLARSRAALLAASFLAATVWRRHPITRHDGPASVRAAFTAGELEALADRAIAGAITVCRESIFRLSLVVDRTPSGSVGVQGR
jgi:2-polyprenyl-3-methyl-5-hydroxy-6-metoxy-1,4-benzoquinol methylase